MATVCQQLDYATELEARCRPGDKYVKRHARQKMAIQDNAARSGNVRGGIIVASDRRQMGSAGTREYRSGGIEAQFRRVARTQPHYMRSDYELFYEEDYVVGIPIDMEIYTKENDIDGRDALRYYHQRTERHLLADFDEFYRKEIASAPTLSTLYEDPQEELSAELIIDLRALDASKTRSDDPNAFEKVSRHYIIYAYVVTDRRHIVLAYENLSDVGCTIRRFENFLCKKHGPPHVDWSTADAEHAPSLNNHPYYYWIEKSDYRNPQIYIRSIVDRIYSRNRLYRMAFCTKLARRAADSRPFLEWDIATQCKGAMPTTFEEIEQKLVEYSCVHPGAPLARAQHDVVHVLIAVLHVDDYAQGTQRWTTNAHRHLGWSFVGAIAGPNLENPPRLEMRTVGSRGAAAAPVGALLSRATTAEDHARVAAASRRRGQPRLDDPLPGEPLYKVTLPDECAWFRAPADRLLCDALPRFGSSTTTLPKSLPPFVQQLCGALTRSEGTTISARHVDLFIAQPTAAGRFGKILVCVPTLERWCPMKRITNDSNNTTIWINLSNMTYYWTCWAEACGVNKTPSLTRALPIADIEERYVKALTEDIVALRRAQSIDISDLERAFFH